MSRLFEYLKKVDGQKEHLSGKDGLRSAEAHDSAEIRQILSVLQLPERTNSEPGPRHSIDLPKIPVTEVVVQPEDRLFFHSDPTGPAADRLRLLRMRLRELWTAGKLKTLLITSPLPADGKSTVAMNLATALAEREQSVLLIDSDLHRSSLTRRIAPTAGSGLADCLRGDLNPLPAIRRIEPLGWYFLSCGNVPATASEALHSDNVTAVIQKLSASFDWILLDSPPVIPITDAVLLSAKADGVLLTARANCTPGEDIEKAISLIGRKRVIGLLLNCVEEFDHVYRRYSHYYSHPENKAARPERVADD